MHDSSQNPIAGFIRKMNIQLYYKIARGEYDYEADMAQLQKFLDMAATINSPEAEGNVYITVGMLQSSVGRFADVLGTMDKAMAAFERSTHPDHQQRALGTWAHKGDTLYQLGDYVAAMQTFEAVLAAAESSSPEHDVFGDQYVLRVGMGMCALALEDAELAERLFHRVLDMPDKTNTQHIAAVVDANIGLAECHLLRQEFDAAIDRARLALDIVSRQNDARQAFEVDCCLAHVAAARGDHDGAENHYQSGLAILAPSLRSAHNVVALLQEARYQHRHGNSGLAARFAELAKQHFHAIDVHTFDEEIDGLLS